jgi:hypothetical protein
MKTLVAVALLAIASFAYVQGTNEAWSKAK